MQERWRKIFQGRVEDLLKQFSNSAGVQIGKFCCFEFLIPIVKKIAGLYVSPSTTMNVCRRMLLEFLTYNFHKNYSCQSNFSVHYNQLSRNIFLMVNGDLYLKF